MSLNAKLVVVGGDVKTQEIALRLPSTIGRGRGTTITLPHPLVSRQHCELFEADGRLMVRDLGSLNGTFVNNQRVSEAPLPPGELLTIGTVTFRAVYEAGGATPEAAKAGGKPGKAVSKASAPTPKPASRPSAKKPANDDDEELAFNFDEPLFSEEAKTEDVKAVTQRVEATVRDAGAKKGDKKPAAPAAPAPAAKPAAAKPAPGKGGDETIDFNKWDEAEEEQVSSSSDDDLDDFLKSLGS